MTIIPVVAVQVLAQVITITNLIAKCADAVGSQDSYCVQIR